MTWQCPHFLLPFKILGQVRNCPICRRKRRWTGTLSMQLQVRRLSSQKANFPVGEYWHLQSLPSHWCRISQLPNAGFQRENNNTRASQGPGLSLYWPEDDRGRTRGSLYSILHIPFRDFSNYTPWPAPSPVLQGNCVCPSSSEVQNLPTALWSTFLFPGVLQACSYSFKTFTEKPLGLKHYKALSNQSLDCTVWRKIDKLHDGGPDSHILRRGA